VNEIDDPMGCGECEYGPSGQWFDAAMDGLWRRVINNNDGYAKVEGVVKMAITYSQWQSAASGWQQWGDTTAAPRERRSAISSGGDCASDPTVAPVQFGTNFGADQTLTPQNFSTTAYDNQIPSSNATVTTSGGTTNISGGTLTASMANGGTATEHSPYDADQRSGRPPTAGRYSKHYFTNVRIPKGLNAKFIKLHVQRLPSVKLNTNITQPGTSTTTQDPSQGMAWPANERPGRSAPTPR